MNDRRTEWALVSGVIAAALQLVVGFGLPWLTNDEAAWINAVIAAVAAVVFGWKVRPVSPALFTGLVTAAAGLVAAYGLHVGQGTVAAVNALVLAVVALIARGQVTPTSALYSSGSTDDKAPRAYRRPGDV
jgi:hypothetical protein